MIYKGYEGVVHWDLDSRSFQGEVAHLRRDVITFQGKTVQEAKKAFKESVDDYLQLCELRKEKPEKPSTWVVRSKNPSAP